MSLFADIGARVNAQLQALSGLLEGGPIDLQPMQDAETTNSLMSRLAEVTPDAQPQPPPLIAGLTILQDFDAFSLPAQPSSSPAAPVDIPYSASDIDPVSLNPQPLPPRDGLLLLEPWTGDLSGLEHASITPSYVLDSGLDEASTLQEDLQQRAEPPRPAEIPPPAPFDTADPVILEADLAF